jgi:hypothetical protein
MELHENRVSLNIAILAKKKGYDGFAGKYTIYTESQVDPEYPEGGGPFGFTEGEVETDFGAYYSNVHTPSLFDEGESSHYKHYAAPRRQQLNDWLRENRGLCVSVVPEGKGFHFHISSKESGKWKKEVSSSSFFEEYLNAFENALRIALEMVQDPEKELARL